jgi:hypothetical protein
MVGHGELLSEKYPDVIEQHSFRTRKGKSAEDKPNHRLLELAQRLVSKNVE